MSSDLGRVLIAEDELLIQMNLILHLEDEGLQVEAASSADAALALMECNQDIDVIVTDVNMPGNLDGLGLAAKVHRSWPTVKLIVTSGSPVSDSALPPGAVFIPKPYDSEELAEYVCILLLTGNRHSKNARDKQYQRRTD